MTQHGWSSIFVRLSLALFVGMIGFYKVTVLGVEAHAQRFFIDGFQDHWIPHWLLLILGYVIPYVELVCGGLLFVGLFVRLNLLIVGFLLLIVAYGHLL